jgi:hypothetical protein
MRQAVMPKQGLQDGRGVRSQFEGNENGRPEIPGRRNWDGGVLMDEIAMMRVNDR